LRTDQGQDILPAIAQAGIDRAVIAARQHQQPRGLLVLTAFEAVMVAGESGHGGGLLCSGLRGPSPEIIEPFLGHPC
jgi:hypothetical protein